jgi:ATP-binding cassette, subfamily B, bacterial
MKISNLSFRYPNNEKYILKDVTLKLEEGKSYGFIGPTGEGKSTLVMLMAGLLKPTSGSIEVTKSENEIGYILQDPFLFEGTVLDNIIYGNKDFEDELGGIFDPRISDIQTLEKPISKSALEKKLTKILISKDLNHLLDRFPNGLKTKVTNNSENISLGQKQIINFLRVILREPNFLILDEATANLDTLTEELLQTILNNLPKKTTKIIIAHRLNTLKNVDFMFQVSGGYVKKYNL